MLIKKTNQKIESGAFIHIIGPKHHLPEYFPEEVKDFLTEFQTSPDDFKIVSGIKNTFVVVKPNLDSEKYRKAGAKIHGSISSTDTPVLVTGDSVEVYSLVEGLALKAYMFNRYFTDEKKKKSRTELFVSGAFDDAKLSELNATVTSVYWARDMVNEPLSYLTAERFAEEMKKFEHMTTLKVSVLEKAQIEALKMGGLLAVNRGSIDPPTFTIIEHKPKNARNKKPVVLVGKGVVYDTGGLSLKPTAGSMDVMKSDMGGGAAVAGALLNCALLDLDIHVIGLIPATDNRPGMNAYAPGDIVTMYDGTTVEVLNTDAEGRMILADALAYSKKFDPELVIDLATLTGAAVRAIGHHASIAMGNADQSIFDQLIGAGNETFDRAVQFPFWDEYFEEVKSKIADLKNIGGANAGMITAGKFLEHFVKAPYVHIDIAGPAWVDTSYSYNNYGGTGAGVRLLTAFLKKYNN